jgi:hypothetical protein
MGAIIGMRGIVSQRHGVLCNALDAKDVRNAAFAS